MDLKSMLKTANKLVPFVLIIVAIKFFTILISQHSAVIHHPYQIEFREGASLNLTTAIEKGINPYAIENQPFYADNFGILYSAVTYPLTKVWGLNLITHRIVSAFAILISLILMGISLRKEKVGIPFIVAGIVIFYATSLFYVTPICRPDGFGMMLFLLSTVIPIYYKYSNKSLITASIIALLAFYTKQYGILGFGAILGYIFLFVSMRKAIIHSLAFGIALTASIYIVSHFYECYFYNTTVSMAIAANNNYAYSIDQMKILVFQYLLGITLVILLFIARFLYLRFFTKADTDHKKFLNEKPNGLFNFNSFRGPLIKRNVDVYLVLAIVFFVLLLARLGGNEGTFMTYHFQLLTFFFIVFALKLSSRMPELNLIQVPLIAFCMYTTTVLISTTGFFKAENAADWEKIKLYLETPGEVFNDEAIAAEVVMSGKVPYMSGLTAYYFYSTINENFNKRFPFTEKLKVQGEYYNKLFVSNIETKKFDLIILEKNHWIVKDAFISQYYTKIDSVSLNMYHTEQQWNLFVWEPTKVEDIVPLGL